MTQPFKICPQCHNPAEMGAIVCASCGRKYQSTSPAVNQTQVFSPGGLPPRLSQIRTPADPPVPSASGKAAMLTPEQIGLLKKFGPAAVLILVIGLLLHDRQPSQTPPDTRVEERRIVTEYRTETVPVQPAPHVGISQDASFYMGPASFMEVSQNMSPSDVDHTVKMQAEEAHYTTGQDIQMTSYRYTSGDFHLGVHFDQNNNVRMIVVEEIRNNITHTWRKEYF